MAETTPTPADSPAGDVDTVVQDEEMEGPATADDGAPAVTATGDAAETDVAATNGDSTKPTTEDDAAAAAESGAAGRRGRHRHDGGGRRRHRVHGQKGTKRLRLSQR